MRVHVTGCWRKLCNDELHNFYSPKNVSDEVKDEVSRSWDMIEKRQVHNRIVVGKPERK
jgi:hypothetical protein